MKGKTSAAACVSLLLIAALAAARPAMADAPQIVGQIPENGAGSVDPDLTELRVTFDRDMSTEGYSFCGGGPSFPKLRGRPKWINERTIVMKLRLEPDHIYEMSLNCPSGKGFQSADGTPLVSVHWTFTTGPPSKKKAKKPKRAKPKRAKRERPDTPQVVEMFPENGATDVDSGIAQLRVTFDRDMSTEGYSFCGGGPSFPEARGRPTWIDDRTVVMSVALEPDHAYEMRLNCRSAQAFQSADGTPLASVRWSFSTAAKARKLSKKAQKKLNTRSLKQLIELLRDHYSYTDVRGVDWKKLEKKHGKKIIAAKSTRSWVRRTATLLRRAHDMHLWLRYRDKITPSLERRIKPNYSLAGIEAVLPSFTQRNRCVYSARTDDNIGYVMIATLSRERADQIEEVQAVLEDFKDCKALIIDLRPNGGGAEPLAVPIAAWFVEGTHVYAKHVYRDADAKGGFGRVHDRTIRGHDKARRFDKPVAVLTGQGIVSSCEAFLLMLKQGENVTLIGSRSFGSSGNPKPHTLKNSVEVFIPSWKAMLPDGRCFEGQGIEPDIEVTAKPSVFKKGDPIIERALAHLRELTD